MKVRVVGDLCTDRSVRVINIVNQLLGQDKILEGTPLQQLYALELAHKAVSIATYCGKRHHVEIRSSGMTFFGQYYFRDEVLRVQIWNLPTPQVEQRRIIERVSWLNIIELRSSGHVAA